MSQKELKYLMLHCAATRPSFNLRKGHIERWHKGPRNMPNGKVRYLGKDYASRAGLPNDTIDGTAITDMHGRGWDRCGYSGLWLRTGEYIEITPYNEDPWVDESEKTWGAKGMNSHTRHFCYEGGMNEEGKLVDTRTPEQLLAMEIWMHHHLAKHPDIKFIGHNQVSGKACPCFHVPDFCAKLGIEQRNIF